MQRGDLFGDTSRVETVLRSVARVVGDALATFHCRRGILFRGSFQDTPECGFKADDRSKASVASVSPSVSCTEAKRERQSLNAGLRRGTKLAASRPCIAGMNIRRLRVWTRLPLSLTIVIRTVPSPPIASSQTTPQTR